MSAISAPTRPLLYEALRRLQLKNLHAPPHDEAFVELVAKDGASCICGAEEVTPVPLTPGTKAYYALVKVVQDRVSYSSHGMVGTARSTGTGIYWIKAKGTTC